MVRRRRQSGEGDQEEGVEGVTNIAAMTKIRKAKIYLLIVLGAGLEFCHTHMCSC